MFKILTITFFILSSYSFAAYCPACQCTETTSPTENIEYLQELDDVIADKVEPGLDDAKEKSAKLKLMWPRSFCLYIEKPAIVIAEISNMYNSRFISITRA